MNDLYSNFVDLIYKYLETNKRPMDTYDDDLQILNHIIYYNFYNTQFINDFFIENNFSLDNSYNESSDVVWYKLKNFITDTSDFNSLKGTKNIFLFLIRNSNEKFIENKETVIRFIDDHIEKIYKLKNKLIETYYQIFKIKLNDAMSFNYIWDTIYESLLEKNVNIKDVPKDFIINSFYFGFELETCVNIYNREFEKQTDMMKYLINFFNTKTHEMKDDIRWGSYYDFEARYGALIKKKTADYTIWNIVPDGSIACPGTLKNETDKKEISSSRPQYCILKNTYSDKCPELKYFNCEIISPILHFPEGIEIFKNVYNNYLMDDNITYLVNKSQGLHIHISNPFLNICNFLKLWVIFEKQILYKIVDIERTLDNDYSRPVSEYYDEILSVDNEFSLTLALPNYIEDRYRSVNCKEYKNKRIEIRLYQGTMIYQEIQNWIKLCIYFCLYSIITPVDEIMQISEENLEDLFFKHIIHDIDVSKYFLEKYKNSI